MFHSALKNKDGIALRIQNIKFSLKEKSCQFNGLAEKMRFMMKVSSYIGSMRPAKDEYKYVNAGDCKNKLSKMPLRIR